MKTVTLTTTTQNIELLAGFVTQLVYLNESSIRRLEHTWLNLPANVRASSADTEQKFIARKSQLLDKQYALTALTNQLNGNPDKNTALTRETNPWRKDHRVSLINKWQKGRVAIHDHIAYQDQNTLMIKGINSDGQVVTLGKDFQCRLHEGSHWLDANKRWRQRNQTIDCSTSLGVIAKAREEIRRLDEKLFHKKVVLLLCISGLANSLLFMSHQVL